MSTLIVFAYPEQDRAAEVLDTLRRLQGQSLIELDDAVVVTVGQDGKPKVHGSHALTGAGALTGGLFGLVFGLLLFIPVFGFAVGAGIGALMGHFSHYGIDEQFIKSLSEQLKPGSSALFLQVVSATPDRVIAEIGKYGGTVLQTSLSNDDEAKLRSALAKAQASETATA